MMYTVINSKMEDGKYNRTWLKYKTLQEAKEEEAKHQDNEDYSMICVLYDHYIELVNKLNMLESDLIHIRDLCDRSKDTMYYRIDQEVLNDINRRR